MKGYKINEIIEIINNKKRTYMSQYGEMPNIIEIGKYLLFFINIQYLSTMNIPISELKTLYGMEIIINDYIEEPAEIKVYYIEKEKYNG